MDKRLKISHNCMRSANIYRVHFTISFLDSTLPAPPDSNPHLPPLDSTLPAPPDSNPHLPPLDSTLPAPPDSNPHLPPPPPPSQSVDERGGEILKNGRKSLCRVFSSFLTAQVTLSLLVRIPPPPFPSQL
ncbi:hypothetical protein BaRGS_00006609 [Batillaria attramentaria]|uniref:Uncharacterized protein n=1 Tax=Batillaria attramentaria TaxID=370345 RepID=A0ABD0LSI1_9CAEN